jgi:hypothetical protein
MRDKVNDLSGKDVVAAKEKFFLGFKKVESGCWEWQKGKVEGYGALCVGSMAGNNLTTALAHRLSYRLFVEKIPKGLLVLHRCNNRKCVNPEHLYAGTNQDNTNDKMRAGMALGATGESGGHSKLTEEDVIEMRKMRQETGMSYKKLANLFNVSDSAAWSACTKKTWKHIDEEVCG